MLQVTDLAKYYNGQPVFSGFDLHLPAGRFQVLLGPSGCGKTTLFNTLTGVVAKDAGTLSWQGNTVQHLGNVCAYMHQKDLLLPWFSLMDNALLPARTRRRNMAAARDRAQQLFSRLGLEGYESHRPDQVSGGMRQRCALVRTLMCDRDLILLDEPLSALDAITRQRLQHSLLLLQTEFGKTILMITHDVDEALLLADDIFLLTPLPMAVTGRFSPAKPKPRAFDDPELLHTKAEILNHLEKGGAA
jgi:ABC-type nitrate/sulfonate/bicarbonate transport system ATPase subunit